MGNGHVVRVSGPGDFAEISVGEVVHLEAEFGRQGFGFASAVVVRRTSGELILAGWIGRPPPAIAEFSLAYRPARCLARLWSYARALDLDLVANGQRIGRGESLVLDGYRIRNENGVVLYAVHRTDTTSPNFAGMIEPVP